MVMSPTITNPLTLTGSLFMKKFTPILLCFFLFLSSSFATEFNAYLKNIKDGESYCNYFDYYNETLSKILPFGLAYACAIHTETEFVDNIDMDIYASHKLCTSDYYKNIMVTLTNPNLLITNTVESFFRKSLGFKFYLIEENHSKKQRHVLITVPSCYF